jgi:hypothetical protein
LIDLLIKRKIRIAQPIKLFKILVVKDGAKHAGKLPELGLPGFVKATFGDQPSNHFRLPQRNYTVPLLRRGCVATRCGRCPVHDPLASAITTVDTALSCKSGIGTHNDLLSDADCDLCMRREPMISIVKT